MDGKLRTEVEKNLNLLVEGFQSVLYEEDDIFLENMKKNNLAGDDIRRYQFWEWTQGVGMYGFWRFFEETKEQKYLDLMTEYYDRQMAIGFPAKNVNTCAPMLAMAFLAEHTGNEGYMEVCKEWAAWIMSDFPRTLEGGFQHITSDTLNDQELWDDTLFMTVLFLAKMGDLLDIQAYVDEAVYQFLLHIKYLTDKKTGLFYHGWTFNGHHNFVEALWGRGNSWITSAVPELLDIIDCMPPSRRMLVETVKAQAATLAKVQNDNGMWHTLLDDPTSYVEASATSGIAYGLLRSVKMGLLDESYEAVALKALPAILDCITEEGTVKQVSYGTAMGRENKQFYKDIELRSMPYGQAMAILFLLEVLKTNKES